MDTKTEANEGGTLGQETARPCTVVSAGDQKNVPYRAHISGFLQVEAGSPTEAHRIIEAILADAGFMVDRPWFAYAVPEKTVIPPSAIIDADTVQARAEVAAGRQVPGCFGSWGGCSDEKQGDCPYSLSCYHCEQEHAGLDGDQ